MFTRIRTFLKPHIFVRISVDRALNRFGKRFQNNALSVTGFTGFVWMEGRFLKYQDSCGRNLRYHEGEVSENVT